MPGVPQHRGGRAHARPCASSTATATASAGICTRSSAGQIVSVPLEAALKRADTTYRIFLISLRIAVRRAVRRREHADLRDRAEADQAHVDVIAERVSEGDLSTHVRRARQRRDRRTGARVRTDAPQSRAIAGAARPLNRLATTDVPDKVFISYSHRDGAVAEAICTAIEADGHDVLDGTPRHPVRAPNGPSRSSTASTRRA